MILSIENGCYYVDGEKFYFIGSSFVYWLVIKVFYFEGYVVLIIVDVIV